MWQKKIKHQQRRKISKAAAKHGVSSAAKNNGVKKTATEKILAHGGVKAQWQHRRRGGM